MNELERIITAEAAIKSVTTEITDIKADLAKLDQKFDKLANDIICIRLALQKYSAIGACLLFAFELALKFYFK